MAIGMLYKGFANFCCRYILFEYKNIFNYVPEEFSRLLIKLLLYNMLYFCVHLLGFNKTDVRVSFFPNFAVAILLQTAVSEYAKVLWPIASNGFKWNISFNNHNIIIF